MTERIYYWEHETDESRFLRSDDARKMADVAHSAGGEVGVIIDAGGPLAITAVPLGESAADTTRRLEAAGT